MANTIKCFLETKHDSSSFELINKEKYIIGRNSKSLIKVNDPFCSREQVELFADISNYQILIKNIGRSTIGVNGCKLQPKHEINLRHNDVIEVIYEKLTLNVKFQPPPNDEHYNAQRLPINIIQDKRKLTDNTNDLENKKLKICTMNPSSTNVNSWDSVGNGKLLIFTSSGVCSRSKIASYDLDGTIITTLKGNVFPKDYNDWKIAFPIVISKLKDLFNNGYKIVIFTNQAGITSGKTKIKPFKKKIENIISKLNLPIQVFISTGEYIYRKPMIGMWTELIENRNDNLDIEIDHSFYCGDAAGRIKTSTRKRDFSPSDRLFALNIKLPFYTPEEHFLDGQPEPYELPLFRPQLLKDNIPLLDPSSEPTKSLNQEIVVLVGFPGSGKSCFSKKYFSSHPYISVSQDISGSWQTCLQLAEQALRQGKSICVDNTNPDPESRYRWINLAKSQNVQIRCFRFNVSLEHALHNIKFRELTDTKHSRINKMILNVYKSKFKEPTIEEGFKSIAKVNFLPYFENSSHENLYKMYLT